MKSNIHLVLIAFLLLLSCGSTKKIVKNDLHEITQDSTHNEFALQQSISSAFTAFEQEVGKFNLSFTIYDSSKPTDSITGKPPVLAEGMLSSEYEKDSKTESSAIDSKSMLATETNNSRKETIDKAETAVERKETSVPRQIGVACAGFALLVVVVWLLYKRFK